MRILLLCRYDRMGASSRLRMMQYLPFFESKAWRIDVEPLFSAEYLKALNYGRPRWKHTIAGYCRRLKKLLSVRGYDLIWLEKELFPFLPAGIERLLKMLHIPYTVDYDDALFHRYDQHSNWFVRLFLGKKIDSVMIHASLVIAGNEYLAERAHMAGAPWVEIVPTVVDLTRYSVKKYPSVNDMVRIVWIGSPSTVHYLSILHQPLLDLSKRFSYELIVIGGETVDLPGVNINFVQWLEETEVLLIQSCDIGVMPLFDNLWEKGKCGYKLIQYMACGLPVIASPVGVNRKIINEGENGYLANDTSEWVDALEKLISDASHRQQLGQVGRKLVEENYCIQQVAPQLISLISRAMHGEKH